MGGFKPLVMFIFFTSAFLIMTGIYEQKLAEARNNKQIEYRFIPRTYYEEQMGKNNTVTDKMSDMFMMESPWFDRTVGALADIPNATSTKST